MAIEQIQSEHYRLSILYALQANNNKTNHSMIQSCCHQFGHNISTDRIKIEIAWLKEQNLVRVENVGDYLVVSLTARGSECVQGFASVPGVKQPRVE